MYHSENSKYVGTTAIYDWFGVKAIIVNGKYHNCQFGNITNSNITKKYKYIAIKSY